jgi:tRNA threonylcarbamoyl adenosine modification protein (Sua5/YciO/YrdC/YwlC family)
MTRIRVRALIFDLDGTLYRNPRLDRLYEESAFTLLAERRRIPLAAARRLFAERYRALALELGRQPSKLYTLSLLGISDKVWAASHGRLPVEKILRPDRRLRAVLAKLARTFRLGIVTNNHRANTLATLRVLGIQDLFDEILTLSESRRFKPAPELYTQMAARLGVTPADCLSLGDRYDLDLAPAASVGMPTLLVRRMADVYALPEVLAPKLAERIRVRGGGTAAAVTAAACALRAGRLAVVPTDTVYGLAAAPDPQAVRWLFRAKGRLETNPLVLLIADPAAASRFVRVPARARELMARHWPGALTLVLPVKPGTPWGRITRGGGFLGLRVPDQPLLRTILRAAGGAAVTTSANPSGQPAPATAGRIEPSILAFAQVLIDAGPAPIGRPSTVVKISGRRQQVLRVGSLKI